MSNILLAGVGALIILNILTRGTGDSPEHSGYTTMEIYVNTPDGVLVSNPALILAVGVGIGSVALAVLVGNLLSFKLMRTFRRYF